MNKIYLDKKDKHTFFDNFLKNNEYINCVNLGGFSSYQNLNIVKTTGSIKFYKKNNYITELIKIYPIDIANIINEYSNIIYSIDYKINKPMFSNGVVIILIYFRKKHNSLKIRDKFIKFNFFFFVRITSDIIKIDIFAMNYNSIKSKRNFGNSSGNKFNGNVIKATKIEQEFPHICITNFLNEYIEQIYSKNHYFAPSNITEYFKKINKNTYEISDNDNNVFITIYNHVALKYIIVMLHMIIRSLKSQIRQFFDNDNSKLFNHFTSQRNL
jgi:hypothetical protein